MNDRHRTRNKVRYKVQKLMTLRYSYGNYSWADSLTSSSMLDQMTVYAQLRKDKSQSLKERLFNGGE